MAIMLSLTVASGLVHGYLDGRWTAGPDVHAIGAKLPELPQQVGPWVRVGDHELHPSALKMLRCYGYLSREYWNPDTGERVSVAVLFGPRGPIAVHTPEICYSSAGTRPLGERVAETIQTDGNSDELWNVQFARGDEPTASLDVWYAWSDGGPWQAGEYPRFWLTDRLYKIQLASAPRADGSSFPSRDFLTHFLPAVRGAIGGS
jgi:hypothetical protein